MNYRIPTPNVPKFAPPVYMCRRTSEKPILDGDLEKPFWKNAEWTEDFADIEGDIRPKPRMRTRAKMLWDGETVYFGAELMGDEIWSHVTEHDDVIFRDNDFEIFIDPDSDSHCYCEFEMNALNTTWDLLLTKPYRDGGFPLNSLEIKGLRTAVKIYGKLNDPTAQNVKWSCEIAMPVTTFLECCGQDKKALLPGEFWRVGFSRVQWTVDVKDGEFVKRLGANGNPLPEDNWVWAPTGIVNMHYPELWGFVFFCDGDENYIIPADEHLKWELRRVYYALHACFDETGSFNPRIKLPNPEFTPEIQVTSNTFELSCKTSDGKGKLLMLSDGRVRRV